MKIQLNRNVVSMGKGSRAALILFGLGFFAAAFAAPPVPVLNTPANNATGVSISTDTLKWAASTGAMTYRVELSTDSTFATTLVNDSTVTTTLLAGGALANNTVYYWRVNAKNGTGTSAFSTRFSFTTIVAAPTAPVLNTPANNATGVSVSTDTLKWAAVTGAATYRVQLSTDSTFATTLVNDSTVTTTLRAGGALANNTVYYWRVNAKNAGGTSAFSTRSSFTTILAAPVPSTPANGATGLPITADTLKWTASTGAVTYRVQLSTDSNFATTTLNDSTVTATQRAVGTLANNTTYYWRVNAKNTGGTSAFSTRFSFTTIVAVPTAPVLSTPANNALNQPLTDTLKWAATANAATYRVELSTDSTFATTLVNDSTVATNLRAVTLVGNTVYFWRVNAKNVAGTSAFSTRFKFTSIATIPAAPVLGAPANNATGVVTSPTLSWNASAGAVSYTVQLSVDSNFTSPGNMLVDDSGITATSLKVGPIANGLTYYWRVNAENALGSSAFSARFVFTTAAFVGILPNKGFALEQLNADNGKTLQFALPNRSHVSITLFDSQGRMLEKLLNEDRNAGNYTLPLPAEKLKGTNSFLDFQADGFHKTLMLHF